MFLVIDNYDSFVHNLARYCELAGQECRVVRNDRITLREIQSLEPDAIVLSPGPCTPDEAGLSLGIIRQFGPSIPILGVCLGHQCIGQAYGASVAPGPRPVHGESSAISHDGRGIFKGLPQGFQAGRYHSLIVSGVKPDSDLETAAIAPDGTIMALRHKRHPVHGVQFHPESVLTEHGLDMTRNFCALAEVWNTARKKAA